MSVITAANIKVCKRMQKTHLSHFLRESFLEWISIIDHYRIKCLVAVISWGCFHVDATTSHQHVRTRFRGMQRTEPKQVNNWNLGLNENEHEMNSLKWTSLDWMQGCDLMPVANACPWSLFAFLLQEHRTMVIISAANISTQPCDTWTWQCSWLPLLLRNGNQPVPPHSSELRNCLLDWECHKITGHRWTIHNIRTRMRHTNAVYSIQYTYDL